MFIEVTDTKQIADAQRKMASNLEKQFPFEFERGIGWPSGKFTAQVRFASQSGSDVRWWCSNISDDKMSVYNLFGRGDPHGAGLLLIDLQFNLPIKLFNRMQGGVFVNDIESQSIVLAHRGIVTRGKSRVPRELLLQEADLTPESVSSDVRPHQLNVFLVAPIDSSSLGESIGDFATEIRRAASLVMSDEYQLKTGNSKNKLPKERAQNSRIDDVLRSYFDEFTGKKIIRRASHVQMNCRHGSVVKALRDRVSSMGKVYKSVAMDLVVETEDEVLLFEVKTGADSQSIYTGIGQLYFHAAVLSREFPEKLVHRHLVIPFAPDTSNRKKVCQELGIKIVTFGITGNTVTIASQNNSLS